MWRGNVNLVFYNFKFLRENVNIVFLCVKYFDILLIDKVCLVIGVIMCNWVGCVWVEGFKEVYLDKGMFFFNLYVDIYRVV